MRTSIALAVVGAALAAAQSLSSLPQCGQTCINNMIEIGPSLGCSQGNVTCYCSNPAFGYGIRDCSIQSCSSADEANKVIAFGTQYCQKALAGNGNTSPSAQVASSTGALTSGVSSSGAIVGGGGKKVPLTTSTQSGVETVDGSKITTATGTTTIYGVASALTTVVTSDGSKITSTTGATTLTGKAASKATASSKTTGGSGSGGGNEGGSGGSGNGGSGNSGGDGSSGNAAPVATAMPCLIAAAALAVLAL